MLQLKNATLRRGTRVLFSEVDLTVHRGYRVGVTGANGAGKSSLFAMLLGRLEADEGDVSITPGLVFASTDQEVAPSAQAAREYVIDGDQHLRELQQALAEAEAAGDGTRQARVHADLEQHGAYSSEARAAALLNGLGFSEAQQSRPVADFSGGWRMRLNLARALMCPSDVLLLDEPTNHLDLDAVLWLESWLLHYPGTLLLISHDREFLDRVCTHIAHIEHGGVRLYTGGYSDFETQRAAQLANQQATFEKQQREIAHMEDFVRRFRAKASKARQAQSRLKALERMEQIMPAHVDQSFNFSFREPGRLPSPLLTVEKIDCGYPGNTILSGVNFSIEPGDRIGLLGMNGAGKSTLIKSLVSEIPLQGGKLGASPHLRTGYFAQHQLELLHDEETPLSYLMRIDRKAAESELRDYVGGFGFRGDDAFQPVAQMSGGEKARLVLAAIVYQKPNFLVLDEPTNHLDIDMRHALTVALQSFQGALLIVSHDRHLLRCSADTLKLVDNGRVRDFDDDLDAYAGWLAEQRREAGGAAQKSANDENSAAARKERKRRQAEARQRLQPLKKQLDKLEKAVDKAAAGLAQIETALSDAALYTDEGKERLQTLLSEQAALKKEHDTLETQWMEAMEAYEEASQESA
ncbi:ATP-binding cassette domain-containing protein [Granulosicoccaceae sp. 1_MG-2023]|nr:ATP-binding cassette domain-containing protein [Granulosicoccaceae sp. 1_MG-2023]